MRFKLYLKPTSNGQRLLFNYQYPLMSWIYSLIANADADYATFLHQQGYPTPNKRKTFKHFTFSTLQIPKTEKIKPGDTYMTLRSQPNGVSELTLIVSFYVEAAAEDFIVGLFQHQRVSLFNQKYQANFEVVRVETQHIEIPVQEPVLLRTLSPMVIAEKIDNMDQYLHPTHERFANFFALNLWDKYQSVQENPSLQLDEVAINQLIKFRLLPNQEIKVRKILIKEGKTEQTKIVGYYNFQFELTAPPEVLEVGLLGGFGKYSTVGMGCCEVGK